MYHSLPFQINEINRNCQTREKAIEEDILHILGCFMTGKMIIESDSIFIKDNDAKVVSMKHNSRLPYFLRIMTTFMHVIPISNIERYQ